MTAQVATAVLIALGVLQSPTLRPQVSPFPIDWRRRGIPDQDDEHNGWAVKGRSGRELPNASRRRRA
jgi:hypothetical protein